MTNDTPINLRILDAKDLDTITSKKQRADWVLQVIKESGLDNDKEFMEQIDPLLEELLKD